jgi:hypothetical protein
MCRSAPALSSTAVIGAVPSPSASTPSSRSSPREIVIGDSRTRAPSTISSSDGAPIGPALAGFVLGGAGWVEACASHAPTVAKTSTGGRDCWGGTTIAPYPGPGATEISAPEWVKASCRRVSTSIPSRSSSSTRRRGASGSSSFVRSVACRSATVSALSTKPALAIAPSGSAVDSDSAAVSREASICASTRSCRTNVRPRAGTAHSTRSSIAAPSQAAR